MSSFMKVGPGDSELWGGVENRPLPLTRPMAYACTTVRAVIAVKGLRCLAIVHVILTEL